LHGTQVELKKFNTTQDPRRRANSKGSPSYVVLTTGGAGLMSKGESAVSVDRPADTARTTTKNTITAATPEATIGPNRRSDTIDRFVS
jgi:uncharacterized NAD-dependent epimerase/dehydratase family protein